MNGKLVEVETAHADIFKSYLTIDGRADADQSTIATAKAPGVITSVSVSVGQAVFAGQVLASLDANAIRQSRAPLEQQLIFATTLYEKQKRLWEQGIGTEVQYLQAKTQMESLQKQLYAIDAQIAMYLVTSPINGTVESVDARVGQAAAPGMPLFKVVNLSALKVVADVAESYSKKINQGDAVMVEFSDLDKKIDTRISFASKIIDPVNRTFKIESRIPSQADVKPNMIAKLKIVDYENKAAITVPTNAIQNTEEGDYVMVAVEENGKTVSKKRPVTVGKSGEGRTEIVKGIEANDRVIVVGYQELNDGQQVAISTPATEEK